MRKRLRRAGLVLLMTVGLSWAVAAEAVNPVLAQDQGPITAPAEKTSAASESNYVVPAIAVIFLFGGALYAVCRTSHRV